MNEERLLTPAHGESVHLTGDVHGRFDRVITFCLDNGVTKGDALVILGDAGLNYYGDGRDILNKLCLSELAATFFCVHGNHEMRPSPEPGYELRKYRGGRVWVEPAYPGEAVTRDGEHFAYGRVRAS